MEFLPTVDLSAYVPLGENDQLPRTLDSRKSYKQLILFDLTIIQEIRYLQRKKLILLSENKTT